MTQEDHDAIIRLTAEIANHQKTADAIFSEVGKLSSKLDRMYELLLNQQRDIKDLQSIRRDDDLRIATLESQVDSLMDSADRQQAITAAMTKKSDSLAKQWALVSGIIVFAMSNGQHILDWIIAIARP